MGPVLVHGVGYHPSWLDPCAFVAPRKNVLVVLGMRACVDAHLFRSKIKVSEEICDVPIFLTKLLSEDCFLFLQFTDLLLGTVIVGRVRCNERIAGLY